MYKKLEELGFFEWLDKVHNLVDTDMKPEYLDRLPLDDIHRTVCNAMAFRWFRENYNLYGCIVYQESYRHMYEIVDITGELFEHIVYENEYSTYEEAENACIDKLISIAKQ